MKRVALFCFLFGVLSFAHSQIDLREVQVQPAINIQDVDMYQSSALTIFFDKDGDGDTDFLFKDEYAGYLFYENDGMNNFSVIKDSSLPDLERLSVDIADIDGDSDLDLLFTGDESGDYYTHLYTNDGAGNFSQVMNTPFDSVSGFANNKNMSFVDSDGDGDQDVFITGMDNNRKGVAKLYTNDGSGNFAFHSEIMKVKHSCIVEFNDIDGDSDFDLYLSGTDTSNINFTYILSNDGTGNFTQTNNNIPIYVDKANFIDINNDGDKDLIIQINTNCITYQNDGSGNFVQIPNSFPSNYRDITVADIDYDNDDDILFLTDEGSYFDYKLYENMGGGTFVETSCPFHASLNSNTNQFADIDGDNDLDFFTSGRVTDSTSRYSGLKVSLFYLNDGTGSFTEMKRSMFYEYGEDYVFGDIDNDNDQDLITISNYGNINNYHIPIFYLNDGLGNFEEYIDTSIYPRKISTDYSAGLELNDIDNDGDLDLFFFGPFYYSGTGALNYFMMYENDGNGNFIEDSSGVKITNIGSRLVYDFADMDNDGNTDIVIVGSNGGSYSYSTGKIFYNDGTGVFTEDLISNYFYNRYQLYPRGLAVGDVNGDNNQDIVLVTFEDAQIWINDGNGDFYRTLADSVLNDYSYDGVELIDIDKDNDLDILTNGRTWSNPSGDKGVTELFINDGTGIFELDTNMLSLGQYYSNTINNNNRVVDVNLDGYDDIIFSGNYGFLYEPVQSNLYLNDGNASFNQTSNGQYFYGNMEVEIFCADIDNDNDDDLLMVGKKSGSYGYTGKNTYLFINESCTSVKNDIIYACDSFTWINGITYTASIDTVRDTISQNGCLTEVSLDLTIYNSSITIDTQFSCGSFTWIDGNTYYGSNDSAYYTYTGSTGCDSIVTLDLTILNSTTSIDTQTTQTCTPFTWIDGNTYYTSTDTPTYTLINAQGCDSIVTLDLTIEPIVDSVSITRCDYYVSPDYDFFTGTGFYDYSTDTISFTLTSSTGCDSTVFVDLTINHSSNPTRDSVFTCDSSYTWIDGNTYNLTNSFMSYTYTASYTYTNNVGCDSIVDLYLARIDGGIAGVATTSSGQAILGSKVLLIEYDPIDSTLMVIDSTVTDSSFLFIDSLGIFVFPFVQESPNIFVKIIPDSVLYPGELPTYYNGSVLWQGASPAFCESSFSTIAGVNPGGDGFIGGYINQGAGKSGNAAGGVTVILVNSDGEVVAMTTTDANGYFSFDDIPEDDTYSIWVDQPGVNNNIAPEIELTNSEPEKDSLQFLLHPTYLELLGDEEEDSVDVGIVEYEQLDFKVYPNPTNSSFNIDLSGMQQNNGQLYKVEIYDVVGQLIYSKEAEQEIFNVSTDQWSSGLYNIRLINKSGNAFGYKKVVVTGY